MDTIKTFRKCNKMSQVALAEYLKVTQGFISQMEKEMCPIPDWVISKILDNPNGWDTSMLNPINHQSAKGDNTIQVTGTNVDMRNINQSKGNTDDAKRVKELEERVAELTKDKERLQNLVDKMQAQIEKLLEKI